MYCKDYFSGLRMGLEAVSICNDVKKIDPSNAEACFILGLYGYARAELKKKFMGIFFWYTGDKKSGIKAIEFCRDHADIAGTSAAMMLPDIYVKEKMYDSADVATEKILIKYPACRFALWARAKMYDAIKEYMNSAVIYSRLAEQYKTVPDAYCNYISTLYLQAKSFYSAGDNKKAGEILDDILSKCKYKDCENCTNSRKLLRRISSSR